jgi:hypothetical protein
MQDRRHFLKTGFSVAAAGLAGAAALVHAREYWKDYTCLAPIDILDDLLRDEGFTDVPYVPGADSDIGADRVASGDADFVQDFAATSIPRIDAGVPAVMLAGVHPACFELFAHESIRSVVDHPGQYRDLLVAEVILLRQLDRLGLEHGAVLACAVVQPHADEAHVVAHSAVKPWLPMWTSGWEGSSKSIAANEPSALRACMPATRWRRASLPTSRNSFDQP